MSTNVKEYVDSLWWLFVLQGIATLVFGVVALFFPGLTLASLITLFAVYAVVVGVVELVHGFRDVGRNGSWWFSLLVGVVFVAVGVYLVNHPLLALNAFLVTLGALLLARGIADLVVSVFYTDHSDHRWLWVISGVVGVVAGIWVWRSPVSGGLAFVWVLGLYALIAGSVVLAYAFRVRDIFNETGGVVARLARK